ncbi:hypothetical protein DSECCO2_642510 [anaerobic digester metagenome]
MVVKALASNTPLIAFGRLRVKVVLVCSLVKYFKMRSVKDSALTGPPQVMALLPFMVTHGLLGTAITSSSVVE